MSILVISGYGETAESPANGLNELADKLRAAFPGTPVSRHAWNADVKDEALQSSDPLILIGHSYGGFRSVFTAEEIFPKKCHLILFDPVRWGGDQFGGHPLELTVNVVSTLCYTRMAIMPPWSSPLAVESGDLFKNIKLFWKGHNNISTDENIQQTVLERVESIMLGTQFGTWS